MKRRFLALILCLAMVSLACTDHVIIGDNEQLPGTDAGADVQADAQAEAEAEAAVEAEAHQPVLTVAFNPAQDPGSYINKQDKYVPSLWVDLMGDELEDLTFDAVRITRSGAGQTKSVQAMLCDKDFKCYLPPTYLQPFDAATGQAVYSGLKIKVPAKTKVQLVLVANYDGTEGEQHAFSIAKASDITVDKGAIVQGAFPIQGPIFILSDGYYNQLNYGLDDPPEKTIQAGAQDVLLFAFWAKSVRYTIATMGWGFGLHAEGANLVCGSKGSMVIKNIRVWANGDPISNPVDIDCGAVPPPANDGLFATQGELISQTTFEPAKMQHYEVRGDVATAEDAPAEFFGQSYHMSLKLPPQASDILLSTFADMLNPGTVYPLTDLQGNAFKVVAP